MVIDTSAEGIIDLLYFLDIIDDYLIQGTKLTGLKINKVCYGNYRNRYGI